MEEEAVEQVVPEQTVKETVYVPGAVNEIAVVPLLAGENTTFADVADHEYVRANVDENEALITFASQTGDGSESVGVITAVESVILSTANEGSVAAALPSILTQLNPTFTLGLLFADAGRATE
jgi:hypothetical protein